MSAPHGRAESKKHLEGLQAALAISGRAQHRENPVQQASLDLNDRRRQRQHCDFNTNTFMNLKGHSHHRRNTE